jgi:hypothetical protein
MTETDERYEKLKALLAEAVHLIGVIPPAVLEERGHGHESIREDIKRLWYAFGLDHGTGGAPALRR